MYLTELDAAIRLVVAVLLGGIIGFERERAEKPAGIRTYALVCEGAALFMLCSLFLGDLVFRTTGDIYDPSRIASTVVQGIGFLAAGVIFASRGQIKGLTTAAGIWVTAAIGLAVGAGFYIVAGVATALALLTLYPVQILERKITKGNSDATSGVSHESDQPKSPFRSDDS
jgi:putative Mg2+ transporter-C (MgtC) family protein